MNGLPRRRGLGWALGVWLLAAGTALGAAPHSPARQPDRYTDVLEYIHKGWDTLSRSMNDCATLADPKVPDRAFLYLPASYPEPASLQTLRQKCNVRVARLPVIAAPGKVDLSTISPHGLLYLENKYVVPGGMFNEMYGWDSYFIVRGLVRDGRPDLARGMVRNFFFEIEHYGAVLNANRTYYLTRSQPPFLSSMVLAVSGARKGDAQERAWLAEAYPYIVRDYQMWTREPHLAGGTGLSRYFDFGDGPVPEIVEDHDRYYRDVVGHFLRDAGRPYLIPPEPRVGSEHPAPLVFTIQVCEAHPGETSPQYCDATDQYALTDDYYKGDRSMRESGFDISNRFGPFSADTHHYAAVDLNSLLYKTETDLEWISAQLGRTDDARQWRDRAAKRKALMQRYLWDASRGQYFDYNFQTGQRSTYEYATTFYPLWAGLASPEQAQALARALVRFEQPGGLAMSRTRTQLQWDYPYGWAPIHLLTVEGLRRYGYHAAADRLSLKFIDMIAENFRRDGAIHEKYDVVARSSQIKVAAGYKENVVGFGWTNGAFVELLSGLRVQRPASPVGRHVAPGLRAPPPPTPGP